LAGINHIPGLAGWSEDWLTVEIKADPVISARPSRAPLDFATVCGSDATTEAAPWLQISQSVKESPFGNPIARSWATMTLTGISNRGLAVIAILVAILWGCIFAERAMVQQARQETLKVLRSRERPVKYQKPASRSAPSRAYAG